MTDTNGITIEAGQYIQVIHAKVKNDNGIYIVEKQYKEDSFCLEKVKQNGEKANTKYNIFFLDQNSIKRNPDMIYTVITKKQLKQAAQEVTAYLKGETAKQKVYTFVKAEQQEIKQGLYIHFVKHVLFKGHTNTVAGKYEITNVYPDGRICLHLIGAKGERIADNMNGYYQFMPIHINFTAETVKQLFTDGDIEIMERIESTKGEQDNTKKAKKQPVKTVSHNESQTAKTEEKQVNEELHVEPEKASEAKQDEKKAIHYSIIEDVDTRDNSKIYVVKLADKISREDYQAVNQLIKSIGGYYSRFKKGFLFKDDPAEKLKTIFKVSETQGQNLPIENQEQTSKDTEQQPKEIAPKYYEINEEDARVSRSLWSMSDYVPNSETNGYKRSVDEVYTMVKQIAKTRPQYLSRALLLADRYAKKFAEWINKGYRIDMMCPSVLITGGSNFPVRKKEKQNRAQDKHMEEYRYIKAIPDQIQDLLSGYHKNVIKSSDSDAIEQLKSKLKKLQAEREQIKTENKQLKAKGESIHAPYILQNLGQNIRNVEQRIEQLEKTKAKPTTDITEKYNTTICKVIENTEQMRLQLVFDGKPSEEVRNILKSRGFRWSPYNEAWQRQLTNNAKYDAKYVLRDIEKLEQEEQTA